MVDAELFSSIFSLTCLLLLGLFLVFTLIVPILTSPWLASRSRDILEMFKLADLNQEDIVLDLGSGDGRLPLAASRVATRAVGVEINPFLNLLARFIAILSANGAVQFKQGNIMSESLAGYSVIFAYLQPQQLEKLKDKLNQEANPGTKFVTHVYKVPGWKPSKSVDDRYHLYVIGD